MVDRFEQMAKDHAADVRMTRRFFMRHLEHRDSLGSRIWLNAFGQLTHRDIQDSDYVWEKYLANKWRL